MRLHLFACPHRLFDIIIQRSNSFGFQDFVSALPGWVLPGHFVASARPAICQAFAAIACWLRLLLFFGPLLFCQAAGPGARLLIIRPGPGFRVAPHYRCWIGAGLYSGRRLAQARWGFVRAWGRAGPFGPRRANSGRGISGNGIWP